MTSVATFADALRCSRFAYVAGLEQTSARPTDPFWRASWDLGTYHRTITLREAAARDVEQTDAVMP